MSISYELAKKLKEAGFPFNPNRRWDLSDYYWDSQSGDERNEREKVWIPTLSELIGACQKYRIFKTWFLKDGKTGIQPEGGSLDDTVFYETPEEAMVDLWLVLRKGDETK